MPEPGRNLVVDRRAGAPRDATALRALAWLVLYVLVVTLPLFALLAGAIATKGRGFAWDFAMALGYAGLAMLGVQFLLTARFRRATAPFGIDIVYYFHRYLAILAVALVALHAAILVVRYPAALGSAAPWLAPAHMTAGRAALALFVVLVAASLVRSAWRIDYDGWRITHALLAVAAFGLALWHVLAAGHYLDSAWKQALWAAYGVGWLALIAYVRLLRPWRLSRAPWTLVEVRPERGRVHTLVLRPTAGDVPRFSPGQFVWVSIRSSPFAMREHPFSIASSAERRDRLELSIKELGDFTATVGRLPPGERVYVDGPYGTFGVDQSPDAPGYAFVAGGIGIAPVMSMLRTLADRGDRRPLWLFYGNRAHDRIAFREELDELAKRLRLQVVHVLIEPPDGWTGERGYVDEELLMRHLPPERHRLQYFLCGPTAMTTAVERHLEALGVAATRVHSELFEWV
jgi:predicted ferric reductase